MSVRNRSLCEGASMEEGLTGAFCAYSSVLKAQGPFGEEASHLLRMPALYLRAYSWIPTLYLRAYSWGLLLGACSLCLFWMPALYLRAYSWVPALYLRAYSWLSALYLRAYLRGALLGARLRNLGRRIVRCPPEAGLRYLRGGGLRCLHGIELTSSP
ncbi:UNVERIFIED_CONTAM: hypothetical protein Slati_2483900 [Sesamum latifolium]|uniref:Uncharacterized protein n=1 Tax=Sesamum latifolium TaxID=2727402 RepID=A0AAW2WG22_9LAMI